MIFTYRWNRLLLQAMLCVGSEGKYEEADPYLETAYKLACQLPYEEGFKFRICTVWNFLSTLNFIDKGDLYIEYVEK